MKRELLAVIVVIAVIALMAVIGARTFGDSGQGASGKLSPVSPRPAPEFSLPDLMSGERVELSAYRGKTVVLGFGASWCTSCRKEAPGKEALWKEVKASGEVQFIGIHIWDTETDSRAFAAEFGISYPMVLDGQGALAVEYGVIGTPETFIIDSAGNIVRHGIGPVGPEELARALDEVSLGLTR